MAEGKFDDAVEVSITKLSVQPEESADLLAPVSIELTFEVPAPLEGAVWLASLIVDSADDAGAARHIVPLAAQALGSVPAGTSVNCCLQSGAWPSAGLGGAGTSMEGASALLRVALFDVGKVLTGSASEGKGDDGNDLAALAAATQGTESMLDVNCVVEVEADTGSLQRVIYNPLE